MKMMEEEKRKGPWTEEEDIVLVNFVHLFGDRRWDFIAKVSGLNRTGKSCRLRWVNYLNPGLKHGKLTSQEKNLILELHAKWGNSWSKIAKKLPGRTDNEIKNYWKTHMRKKAQEKKLLVSQSSSFFNSCSSSWTTTNTQDTSLHSRFSEKMNQETEDGYSMDDDDDIWREIYQSGVDIVKPVKDIYSEQSYCTTLDSQSWDSIWNIDAHKSKMFSFEFDQFPFCFQYRKSSWSLV